MEPPLLFSGLFSARRFYLNLPPPSLHSSSMCSRLPHAYSKSRSPSFPVPRSPRPLLFHPDYCYFRTRFDDPLREVQVATLVSDKIVRDSDPFSHPLSFPSLRSVEQSDNERTVSVNLINLADISAGRRRGLFLRVSRIVVRYARTRRNWITFDSGNIKNFDVAFSLVLPLITIRKEGNPC